MNRIQKAFDEKKKVFIGFVTAGDPNLATTKELVRAMIKGGAGLIEFGIPFSDPVAEGEVIQKADMRALAAGTTTDKIFDLVAELREETQVPLVFLTYANPIYAYGAEKFFTRCEETGVDGVIIPDIPYEEREEMRPFSEPHHVALVPLIAPTSKDRIQKIAAVAQGYVYVVSSLGVTGVRSNITTDIDGIVAEVRKATDIPVAVGFGKKSWHNTARLLLSTFTNTSRVCPKLLPRQLRRLDHKSLGTKKLRSLLHRQQGAEFFGLNYCSGIGSVPPFTASGCSKMKAGDG